MNLIFYIYYENKIDVFYVCKIKIRMKNCPKLLIVLLVCFVNGSCIAQLTNAPLPTEICKDLKFQISSSAVSDGDGGAIIFWKDERETSYGGYTIFAQRITKDGVIK